MNLLKEEGNKKTYTMSVDEMIDELKSTRNEKRRASKVRLETSTNSPKQTMSDMQEHHYGFNEAGYKQWLEV